MNRRALRSLSLPRVLILLGVFSHGAALGHIYHGDVGWMLTSGLLGVASFIVAWLVAE